VANFSPPVFEPDGPSEWEILLRVAGVISGQGPHADLAKIDDTVANGLAARELPEREASEVLGALEPRRGPERLLDLLLRVSPYRLSLAELERNPRGGRAWPREPGSSTPPSR